MPLSPTSRTLKQLRKEGWRCQIVEKWNAFSKTRLDLFGCIDLICIKKGMILGVQATSTGNVPARIAKSLALPTLKEWLEAGGKFWVVGWAKRGARGKVKRWKEMRREFILTNIGGIDQVAEVFEDAE